VIIEETEQINYDWGQGAPRAGLPADGFSARWQRYANFSSGTYYFRVTADDGIRLWVDDRLLAEEWHGGTTSIEKALPLSAGYHLVRLEYYDAAGSARVSLSWGTSPSVTPTATASPTTTPSATPGTGSIEGYAFWDRNGNNNKDPEDPGLPGAVMMLKQGGTERYAATSDANGRYRFPAVVPGQYFLSEKAPPPGYLLNPLTVLISVMANQTFDQLNFGHILAPTSTPTFTSLPTSTRTATRTLTATPTRTRTPSRTPTATRTVTATPSPTPSMTVPPAQRVERLFVPMTLKELPISPVTATPTPTASPTLTPVTPVAWVRAPGLPADLGRVNIVRTQGNVVLVGTEERGIFRSTDGEIWTQVLSAPTVRDLLWQPGAPQIVLAASFQDRVFRSTDGGVQWMPANVGLGALQAYALTFNGGFVYLASAEHGAFRSTADAAHWTKLPSFGDDKLTALEAHPADPHIIYAGTNSQGVFRSPDDGQTWTTLHLPAADLIRGLAFSDGGARLYVAADVAGFWTSDGAGTQWAPLGNPGGRARALFSATEDGQTVLYGGSDDGLYRRLAGSAAWQADGLAGRRVNALAKYGATLLAATDDGLWQR
jgi:photosystem II stability/assembly factor-like uncharacterized protein